MMGCVGVEVRAAAGQSNSCQQRLSSTRSLTCVCVCGGGGGGLLGVSCCCGVLSVKGVLSLCPKRAAFSHLGSQQQQHTKGDKP